MAKKGKGSTNKLTTKQEAFVRHYIANNGNASDAARKAGYSPKTAFRTGQENMQKPAVKAAIEVQRSKILKRIEITAQDVIEGWANIATADVRFLLNDDGSLKPVSQWPDEVARAIQSVRVSHTDKGSTWHVTLSPKLGALDSLGKYFALVGEGAQNILPKKFVIKLKT